VAQWFSDELVLLCVTRGFLPRFRCSSPDFFSALGRAARTRVFSRQTELAGGFPMRSAGRSQPPVFSLSVPCSPLGFTSARGLVNFPQGCAPGSFSLAAQIRNFAPPLPCYQRAERPLPNFVSLQSSRPRQIKTMEAICGKFLLARATSMDNILRNFFSSVLQASSFLDIGGLVCWDDCHFSFDQR